MTEGGALVTIISSLIALVGVLVGLVVWVVKKVMGEITPAIKSFDTYLRDRNGRDAEQHAENIAVQNKMIKAQEATTETLKKLPVVMQKIADKSVDDVKKQSVGTQNVGTQIVNKQE